jgi:hypothetical protein
MEQETQQSAMKKAAQLYQEGRLLEALEAYQGIYRMRPAANVAVRIIRLQRQAKDDAGARSTLEESLGMFPDDFILNHLLARESHQKGDFETYHAATLRMTTAAGARRDDWESNVFWPFLSIPAQFTGKYLFVSGAARSGTSAVGRLLNLSPEVLVFVERYAAFYGYEKAMFNADRLAHLKGHPHEKRNRKLLERYEQVRLIGDKRPAFALSIRATMERFRPDEIRIVHIVRDPSEVGLSFEARAANEVDAWSRDRGFAAAIREINWDNQEILRALDQPQWAGSIRVLDYQQFWEEPERGLELLSWVGAPLPPLGESLLAKMYQEARAISARERRISAEQERVLATQHDRAAYERLLRYAAA